MKDYKITKMVDFNPKQYVDIGFCVEQCKYFLSISIYIYYTYIPFTNIAAHRSTVQPL